MAILSVLECKSSDLSYTLVRNKDFQVTNLLWKCNLDFMFIMNTSQIETYKNYF